MEIIPSKPYNDFIAQTQGVCDGELAVIAITPNITEAPVMAICAPEEAIYITKEQAMAFFGLVEE